VKTSNLTALFVELKFSVRSEDLQKVMLEFVPLSSTTPMGMRLHQMLLVWKIMNVFTITVEDLRRVVPFGKIETWLVRFEGKF
jgi:hypothetical protein